MTTRKLFHVLLALTCSCVVFQSAEISRADLIEYRLPETGALILLRGEVKYNPGGTVYFTHPNRKKFPKKLVMSSDNIIKIHKAPSIRSQYTRMFSSASGDAEALMKCAEFALKHALVKEVYVCAAAALKVDPNNAKAMAIRDLKRKIDVGVQGNSAAERTAMRKVVKLPMKFATSKHFILMHDTPDKRGANKMTRSEERLELLERVYESLLLKFYASGVKLEIPKERMMVVLFDQESDYNRFATSLSPALASAIGFFDPSINMSFFFDHGSSDQFKALRGFVKHLKEQSDIVKKGSRSGKKYANGKEIVRLAEVMSMLVLMDQENEDIEVVSHECTHHLAANTGLFPRHVLVPAWVHEGMASYFEAPGDASWAGIGAVNKTRLEWYNGLAGNRERSNLQFIVGDEIFDKAASHGATLHAYGQAWALTHFMVERHFDEIMLFYRKLGEMPPDLALSTEVLNKLFDQCIKTDRVSLDAEWRQYMRSLKTDTQKIMGKD